MAFFNLIFEKYFLRVKKKIGLKILLTCCLHRLATGSDFETKRAAEVVLVVYLIVHKIPRSFNSIPRENGK